MELMSQSSIKPLAIYTMMIYKVIFLMLEWVGSKEEVMVERGHVNFCWSL